MKALSAVLLFAFAVCAGFAPVASAGQNEARDSASSNLIYADGVKLTQQGPRTYLLTWDKYRADPCEDRAIYDVYRGTREDFDLSPSTLVGVGLSGASFVSREPTDRDYYYQVVVRLIPASCSIHSGLIQVFPLDLGDRYNVSAGTLADTCTAQSTTEVWCPSIGQRFHAVISEQSGHEFLIGCGDADFNGGAWNCVDLRSGYYSVAVHNTTLTILNGGWVEANARTGKTIAPIVPVFSELARIK